MDAEGESVAVLAHVKDASKAKAALAKELGTSRPPKTDSGVETWTSKDGDLAASLVRDFLIAGDAETVAKCVKAAAGERPGELPTVPSEAAAFTRGREFDPAARLVGVLSDRKEGSGPLVQTYTVQTRFDKNGVIRATTSEFGMLGWLIEQFAAE
jgi:hypothetical protein